MNAEVMPAWEKVTQLKVGRTEFSDDISRMCRV